MSYKKVNADVLTDLEYKEMDDLRKAISQNPSYVHPDRQEKFTELFVRSLSYVR